MKKGRVYIIAEAGVNHNGDINLAKDLIDVAAASGADAVKFQTFRADRLVTREAQKADYQVQNTGAGESQYEMLKGLELSLDDHKLLLDHASQKKINFLSTPFDVGSVELLLRLGLQTIKIPSGEITNFPYLRHIGKINKKIILSSGMANLGEVEAALNVLISSGTQKENITVLHATTDYPAKFEDVNLRAMLTIRNALQVDVGYSDHTPGIEVPVAAVALGASVIEKHFTLDRRLSGPDHKASLDPTDLESMVLAIRNIELAMGDGLKRCSQGEFKNLEIVRKSIVAKREIKKGEVFTEENLSVKRPGSGINPMQWEEIIGKKAMQDYRKDEII